MILTGSVGAAAPAGTGHRIIDLVVADFDRPGFVNHFGEAFGAWDRDPRDPTQCCRIQLVDQPRIGDTGYSLRVDHDVDSPNPAYNGLWMKLPALAEDELQNLRVAIRGDSARGYTRRVKLELKDGRHSAVYVFDGIGPSRIRMRIPLQAFGDIERLHPPSPGATGSARGGRRRECCCEAAPARQRRSRTQWLRSGSAPRADRTVPRAPRPRLLQMPGRLPVGLHTVKEFVIVFDDRTVTQPTGTLYLDEVAFERRV